MGQVFSERETGSFLRERRGPFLMRERVFSQLGEGSSLRERRGLLSEWGRFSLRVGKVFFLERRGREREKK